MPVLLTVSAQHLFYGVGDTCSFSVHDKLEAIRADQLHSTVHQQCARGKLPAADVRPPKTRSVLSCTAEWREQEVPEAVRPRTTVSLCLEGGPIVSHFYEHNLLRSRQGRKLYSTTLIGYHQLGTLRSFGDCKPVPKTALLGRRAGQADCQPQQQDYSSGAKPGTAKKKCSSCLHGGCLCRRCRDSLLGDRQAAVSAHLQLRRGALPPRLLKPKNIHKKLDPAVLQLDNLSCASPTSRVCACACST